MAGMINKLLDFVGWEANGANEDEYYDDEQVEETPVQRSEVSGRASRRGTGTTQSNVLSLNQGSDRKVIIRSPQNILEIKELVDHLRARSTVIMNVEKTDPALAQRMVDFLSGAVYCIDGDMEKLSSGVIMAVPNGVDITADLRDDIRNKGVFSWVK